MESSAFQEPKIHSNTGVIQNDIQLDSSTSRLQAPAPAPLPSAMRYNSVEKDYQEVVNDGISEPEGGENPKCGQSIFAPKFQPAMEGADGLNRIMRNLM